MKHLIVNGIVGIMVMVGWVGPISGQQWHVKGVLKANDPESNAYFGRVVDIHGNWAVVGAPSENKDASGANPLNDAGAVYVYRRQSNGQWQQTQKLVAFDREASAQFGYSVAIHGPYIVIGAHRESQDANAGNPLPNAGAAYIYRRNAGGSYQFVQKIVANDRKSHDRFGHAVAIDGNVIVVGAPRQDYDDAGANLKNKAGAAYVFEQQGNTWAQTKKLVATDRRANDQFGYSVAIKAGTIVVGSPYQDYDASGGGNMISNAGALYIFKQTGNTWSPFQKLVSSNRQPDDRFAQAIAFDGATIVASASFHDYDAADANMLSNSGAVFIFNQQGNNWQQVQKIVASDRRSFDFFGFDVDVSGQTLVVGAHYQDYDTSGGNMLTQAGAAYFFEKGPSGWQELHKSVSSQRATEAFFGRSVAIDGQQAIIGAIGDVVNNLSNAGKAYIFRSCRTYATVNTTACESFTSPSGKVWSANGTYHDTISNVKGCDSIITYHLTIDSGVSDTSVIRIGNTLTASLNGATYQWVDCQNAYSPISGATGRTFTPLTSGSYAVVITQGACSDTSGCHTITISGIASHATAPPSVTIHPIPSNGWISIVFQSRVEAHIEVIDAQGRSRGQYFVKGRRNMRIPLPEAPGIYGIRIIMRDGQSVVHRVVRR